MHNIPVILVVAARRFQLLEYAMPKKILERAGYPVLTASNQADRATASNGTVTHVDLLIRNIIKTPTQGIFFIGGPGALEHLDNNTSYNVLQYAHAHNIPLGAICISPRILAHAKILTDRRATGWNQDNQLESIFLRHQADYVNRPVVRHGSIITADGPESARAFATEIVHLLNSKN